MDYAGNIRPHIEVEPKPYLSRILSSTQQGELEIVDAERVMPEIKDPKLISITCRIIKVPSIGRGQKPVDFNRFQPFREFRSRSCLGLLFFEACYPGLQFGDLCIGGSALSIGRNNRTQQGST